MAISTLADELRALVAAFVRKELDARGLGRAMGRYASHVHAEMDVSSVRRLYGRTRNLLAERSDGSRTDDDIREQLRALLAELGHPMPASAGVAAPFAARGRTRTVRTVRRVTRLDANRSPATWSATPSHKQPLAAPELTTLSHS
jgi:hypothetical protein